MTKIYIVEVFDGGTGKLSYEAKIGDTVIMARNDRVRLIQDLRKKGGLT